MTRITPTLVTYSVFLLAACSASSTRSPVSEMSDVRQNFVATADGTRIAFETHGTGETTVVLVHGWTCDRSYWHAQIEPLAQRFQVIAIDLAGHGESDATRTDWTIEAFGGDVAAVITHLDVSNVVLVGHSMGGPVMLEAARQLDGRVRGLIGVDTLKDPDAAISAEQAEQLWAPFSANFSTGVAGFVRGSFFLPDSDPAIVERIATDMASAPPALSIAAGKSLSRYDRRTALDAVASLPLTLINAPVPPTLSDAYRGLHDNMTLIIIDQAGHFPMQEVPELFNSILINTILKMPN